MKTANKSQAIMGILLRDFCRHTATSLSKQLKISRWGVWKILRNLKKGQMILLESIGNGKTSTNEVKLNWSNPLVEKNLSVYLTQEALEYKKWRFNFERLEKEVEFFILFGSILHSPKEANDIDVIIVAKKKNFVKIGDLMINIQISQEKDIHSTNFTKSEFKKELKKGNRAYLDAIKRGVILFGQESFIKFMKVMHGYEG